VPAQRRFPSCVVPRQAGTARDASRQRVVCAPALVGRERELAALTRAFAAPPAVVAVEGEAGIGKSRLVGEFLASSGAPRRCLLACCPPYRQPHTLGAVADAVRQATEDVAGLHLSGLAGALGPLFPEWAGQLPTSLEPAEDATAARHRLFQALVELLGSLKATLLVVEDVHWADEATLEFLLFLATSRPQPLSLVVTYRAEDLPTDSLVRRLSSRLPTCRAGLRLTLGPLDVGETSELVSSMLAGEHVSYDYVAFVHRHTDGVPLAIEESVRLMSERADLVPRGGALVRRLEDIEVPPTVRDVVLERVHRLGRDAQAVMQAAAVLAEPADESMLFAVAGLPADHGRAGLAAALVARLLHEDHHGLVSFRHALAGRAIYDAVPASERRALHRRAGQALEAASPRPLGQLTRHFRGAGDIENWCRYGEQAADLALASGDEATAGALLHDLLTSASLAPCAAARIASKMPHAAFTGSTRYQTLIAALRSVLSAPSLTREGEADLRFQLGRALISIDDYEAARTELERSIPHLAHDPVAKQRALMLLAWRCSTSPVWMRRRWLRRAEAVAVPSASVAERLCLVVDRVSTLLALGEENGWAQANQLPATADTAAERLQLARAALNLGYLAMVWGRYGEACARLDGEIDPIPPRLAVSEILPV
jgi:predicted ATPase